MSDIQARINAIEQGLSSTNTLVSNLRRSLSTQPATVVATTTKSTASSSSSSASGMTFTPVSPPQQIAIGNAMTTWTTVNALPGNAKYVVLDGQFDNSSGNTSFSYFQVRSDATDTDNLFLGATRSGAGNDTTASGTQGMFPCSSGGAFDWQTNTGDMNYVVRIIGYWS